MFGPNQPLVEREYHVRKGTIWNFRFTRGVEALSRIGIRRWLEPFRVLLADADNHGQSPT